MSILWQLSWAGQLAFFALAAASWLLFVAVGRRLLAAQAQGLSRAERDAMAGPWGLMFIASVVATLVTRGRTQLAVVLAVQVLIWAASRRRLTGGAVVKRPDGARTFAHAFALLVAAQLFYRSAIMPSSGSGRWVVPFFDYGWYAQLSRWLFRTGIEHYSVQTMPALAENGRPFLAWYHWVELWVAGAWSEAMGLSPLLVLVFVVYPVCLAMIAFLAWVFLEGLAGRTLMNAPMACGLCLATTLVNRAVMPSPLDAFFWSHSIGYYTNFIVATSLVFASLLGTLRGLAIWSGACLALAVQVGPGLLPLTLPGVAVWCVLHALRSRRLTLSDPVLRFSAAYGLVLAASMAALLVTGHEIRSEAAYNYADVRQWEYWSSVLTALPPAMVMGALVGAPLLWGLRVFGREARIDAGGRERLTLMCFAMFLVAFPVALALRGDGVEKHIVWLMWSAFVLPVGWVGLALASRSGRRGILAAVGMAGLLASGVLTTMNAFGEERRRFSSPGFVASEVVDLASVCQGEPVGYFCFGCRDNQWWVPVHSTWAALSDCRMLRLSHHEKDGWGASAGYWRRVSGNPRSP